MRRRGTFALETLVALPIAGLALASAWFTFHTGARQGAATAALTDLLVTQVRVRAQLEADLGSLVTDGDAPAIELAPDGRKLEMRVLTAVPRDAAARLPARRVTWTIAPARPSGFTIARNGLVLSPRPLREAAFACARHDRTFTVRVRIADSGRSIDVAALHQASLALPGLVDILSDASTR
jgi:hypothetical protein